jgi:hypothetical protein
VFEPLKLSGQFTTSVFHVYCDEGNPILGATLVFSISFLHRGSPTVCDRKKNPVLRKSGQEPIHEKDKAKETRSRHKPKK